MIIPPGTVLEPLEPEREMAPASPKPRRSASKRGTVDRFQVINAFVDITLRSLTRTEGFVWLTLWRDTRNGLARTSYASLSRTCGCRRATVATALRSLREKGLVTIVQRGGKGQGTNVYRLHREARAVDSEPNAI
jgi:hypothetical protein